MEFSTSRTVRFIGGLILMIMAFGLLPFIEQISKETGSADTLVPLILFLIPFGIGIILFISAFVKGGGD
jgi:hypothetical protein